MGLSNLPPGVSSSMIPGNTAEDDFEAKLYEELEEVTNGQLSEGALEALVICVKDKLEACERGAYQMGRQEAIAEIQQTDRDRKKAEEEEDNDA